KKNPNQPSSDLLHLQAHMPELLLAQAEPLPVGNHGSCGRHAAVRLSSADTPTTHPVP
ncbi:unnamed protein product, partial [Urochloa humidicola]